MTSKAMEMMVLSLVKMMGLDPNKMMAAVEDIRKSLSNASAEMTRLRRQNTAIMAHLGIPEPLEDENVSERRRNDGPQHDAIGSTGTESGNDASQ